MAIVTIAAAGCGNPNRPPIGTVEGLVLLDGEPLPNASVTFVIKGYRPSVGFTGPDGRYRLRYNRDTAGAVVGLHSVKIDRLPTSGRPDDVRHLPLVYNKETTLTAEVTGGRNDIDFELSSQPQG